MWYQIYFIFEELVGGTELENCLEWSVHFPQSFLSDTDQEGSSEWRAQKRLNICRRSCDWQITNGHDSKAVCSRFTTQQKHAEFLGYKRILFFSLQTKRILLCRQKEFVYNLKILYVSAELWTCCIQLCCHAHRLSANHSSAPSIHTRPFLCSPFWQSFLISVRRKASKEMNTLLKAYSTLNLLSDWLCIEMQVKYTRLILKIQK